MTASKIKIRVDNSDGTFNEVENILPHHVAEYLLIESIQWKDRWLFTAKELEQFQNDSKKLNPEGH